MKELTNIAYIYSAFNNFCIDDYRKQTYVACGDNAGEKCLELRQFSFDDDSLTDTQRDEIFANHVVEPSCPDVEHQLAINQLSVSKVCDSATAFLQSLADWQRTVLKEHLFAEQEDKASLSTLGNQLKIKNFRNCVKSLGVPDKKMKEAGLPLYCKTALGSWLEELGLLSDPEATHAALKVMKECL